MLFPVIHYGNELNNPFVSAYTDLASKPLLHRSGWINYIDVVQEYCDNFNLHSPFRDKKKIIVTIRSSRYAFEAASNHKQFNTRLDKNEIVHEACASPITIPSKSCIESITRS